MLSTTFNKCKTAFAAAVPTMQRSNDMSKIHQMFKQMYTKRVADQHHTIIFPIPHQEPTLTAETTAASIVGRDYTCDLKHMPLHCVGLPDPCVPLVRLHPEPRSRVRPHVQILKSPPRGLERKGLFLVSDVRRFDVAFPGVWLGQQRAYNAG